MSAMICQKFLYCDLTLGEPIAGLVAYTFFLNLVSNWYSKSLIVIILSHFGKPAADLLPHLPIPAPLYI